MSAYENVIVGKLRLKGKALNVKDCGLKKKKKHKDRYVISSDIGHDQVTDPCNLDNGAIAQYEGVHNEDDRLTPAERHYMERWQKMELRRLAKAAKKSHRDRIHEFNQYLANLTEHYDIPNVGPG
ncbi:Unknown protein [Striga hermonthica]|uniref:Protein FAM32A-like n=1 Tax=Striga hermonthica TaxID=68872 RepID=A0A9N7MWY1_STRHE|nr:Unknown protein [Striga hermonthica]